MIIGVLKETLPYETRVAASPETVKKFKTIGFKVFIESHAGIDAGFSNHDYREAGAEIKNTAAEVMANADILLKINAPQADEIAYLKKSAIIIADFQALMPQANLEIFTSSQELTCFALDLMPRISRAQSMDILSSQSNLAGYKAVINAAMASRRSIPLMMTSAGTLPPAKFLILGLGVAGLQAAATAKRLGAMVFANDIRSETFEQAVSIGAKFIDKIDDQILSQTDIIISSAFSRGKPAPLLLDEKQLLTVKKGAVIIDLAVGSGGNIFGSIDHQTISIHDLTIIGNSRLAAEIPLSASTLFAQNLYNFLSPYYQDNQLRFNEDDEIIAKTCIVKNGQLLFKNGD